MNIGRKENARLILKEKETEGMRELKKRKEGIETEGERKKKNEGDICEKKEGRKKQK